MHWAWCGLLHALCYRLVESGDDRLVLARITDEDIQLVTDGTEDGIATARAVREAEDGSSGCAASRLE